MISNMTFGECLKCLLSTLDISINRLSKAINVDSSLVNRWVHGKRIPSYNTLYIEDISEYLAKNVYNTFQRQRINELFLNVCEAIEAENSIKEVIKKLLLEAQGYSIELKIREEKKTRNHSPNRDQISKSLNSNQLYIKEQNNINDEDLIFNTRNITNSVSLSSEDKIIIGKENVLAASICLLETAANEKCQNNKTIYITYNNNFDTNDSLYNSSAHWRNALLKAINNGWNVSFFLQSNNNIDGIIKFINFAKPLIKTGKFNPYYIKKYDSFLTGKEIFIIPGIGVLSCFPTKLHSGIDCAFYLKNKTAVDIFKDHINLLITACANPMVKNYTSENNMDYVRFFVEIEDYIGNRFLYNYCFSTLTLPENLYEKLLRRKKLSEDVVLKSLELYKKRMDAFLSNIQNYEYKDIYSADSIINLIKLHKLYLYTCTGVEVMELQLQDIAELLQNIINLLKAYDNFNIAFIPQNTDNAVKSDIYYCLVKERQGVLIETFGPLKNMPEVRLSIEEPMLIKAFDEYFKETLEQIAPVNRDKKEIITWLQKQVNMLKKRLNLNNM